MAGHIGYSPLADYTYLQRLPGAALSDDPQFLEALAHFIAFLDKDYFIFDDETYIADSESKILKLQGPLGCVVRTVSLRVDPEGNPPRRIITAAVGCLLRSYRAIKNLRVLELDSRTRIFLVVCEIIDTSLLSAYGNGPEKSNTASRCSTPRHDRRRQPTARFGDQFC